MKLLDRAQEVYGGRCPSEHQSRGTAQALPEGSLCEDYLQFERWQAEGGWRWLGTEEGQKALGEHPEQCLLVSGDRIVGFGDTWRKAWDMANRKSVSPFSVVPFYSGVGLGTFGS